MITQQAGVACAAGRDVCEAGADSFSRGSSWCEITSAVEAKSIIDVLTLGAAQGTELVLEADGDDAEEAVEALAELVENGFPIEDAERRTSAGGGEVAEQRQLDLAANCSTTLKACDLQLQLRRLAN